MTAEQTYRNPKATKAQLREALRVALGLPEEPAAAQPPKNAFKECLNTFQTAYKKQTGLHYQIAAKDAVAMAGIIKKLQALAPGADVVELFTALAAKLPEWYVKNAFSLPVINGKFNEIVAAIRQSKNQINNDYKERIARDLTRP
jgi:hypothetical protein